MGFFPLQILHRYFLIFSILIQTYFIIHQFMFTIQYFKSRSIQPDKCMQWQNLLFNQLMNIICSENDNQVGYFYGTCIRIQIMYIKNIDRYIIYTKKVCSQKINTSNYILISQKNRTANRRRKKKRSRISQPKRFISRIKRYWKINGYVSPSKSASNLTHTSG